MQDGLTSTHRSLCNTAKRPRKEVGRPKSWKQAFGARACAPCNVTLLTEHVPPSFLAHSTEPLME